MTRILLTNLWRSVERSFFKSNLQIRMVSMSERQVLIAMLSSKCCDIIRISNVDYVAALHRRNKHIKIFLYVLSIFIPALAVADRIWWSGQDWFVQAMFSFVIFSSIIRRRDHELDIAILSLDKNVIEDVKLI